MLILLACYVALAMAQTWDKVVDLGYAEYRGTTNTSTNVTTFLSIRYAAPPTQEWRWRAPQPPLVVRSGGILNATTPPPQCPQAVPQINSSPSLPLLPPGGNEDCLFLNVHFPGPDVPRKKLPVIVWIHGGGFTIGNGAAYNGADLVTEANNGAVVVVIQYRLGIFGFLPGTRVKENGALNAGLLDQEFALRWVQKHIAKFGGDPDHVVIWGESAGAGSAGITSSTFLPSQYLYNDTVPESIYSSTLAGTGCNTAADTLACLRATNSSILQTVNAQIVHDGFFGTWTTVPVIDGEFIRRRPTEVLRSGRVNGRALLAVSNANEGALFVDQVATASGNSSQYSLELFPGITPAQSAAIARLYANLGSPTEQANLIMGESIFVCPSYYLLRAFPGAYRGIFAVPPSYHADDLPFYFPTGLGPRLFNNTEFITSFSQSFLDFVLHFDPNIKFDEKNVTPPWARYAPANTEMLFNRTEDGQMVIRPERTDPALLERCAFWESISEFTAQ
ncbi:Carboxylic ester hydrolase [Pleurotus pulmonarius]